tara:strand:+ start:63 stop:515 length:453 start_codon:yes stop_codon:yes gene_type:complete
MAKYAEHWGELLFNLDHLSKQTAKKQFRQDIKYSWGGMCCYCRENKATSLDHVVPRSRGGSNLRSNLLPACRSCQESKGNRIDWYDWFKEQPFFNQDVADLILEHTQNKRFLEQDNERSNHRAEVCSHKSTIRSRENEQASTGENCLTPA